MSIETLKTLVAVDKRNVVGAAALWTAAAVIVSMVVLLLRDGALG